MMKSYIAFFVSFALLGCSTKSSKMLPNSPQIASSIKAYQAIKRDKTIQELATNDAFEAGKVYSLLELEKDPKKAEHLAYLLKSQVKIAKMSAKEKMLSKKLLNLEQQMTKEALKQKEMELKSIKEEKDELIKRDREFEDISTKMTSRGLEFILDDRFFKKDSSKLLISSIRVIDKITDFLREHPDKNILIEGYMNSEKSSSYNLDLSLRRANEVARMLTAQGVSKRRIETKGLGDKESKSEVDIVVKN